MAKTPERPPQEEAAATDHRTPLERMTDLTRAIIRVPKSELPTTKPKKRKR